MLFGMTASLATRVCIQQISSVSQAEQELAQADENTLVVWDVDYTLQVPETMLCWGNSGCVHKNNHRGHEWLPEMIEEIFSKKSKSLLYYQSIWYAKEKMVLVEPGMAALIASLQERRVKTIALTAIPSGPYETIPSLPIWRFNKLIECGIDFNKTNIEDHFLTELTDEHGDCPLFYKGVLCSGTLSKGKVLKAWLKRNKVAPDRVISFDDTLIQSKVIVQEMFKEKIFCRGYEYLGAYQRNPALEKDVVRFQLQYLADYEKWISRDEARKILGK
jgi:hypothetical protein